MLTIVIGDAALRMARTSVLLVALITSSTAAHVAGGGGVQPMAVLALAALSVLPSIWLGNRPRSRAMVCAVLCVGQAVWHYGLAIGHGSAPLASYAASSHTLHGNPDGLALATNAGHELAHGGIGAPGWWMTAAHVLAAIALAQALHLFDELVQFLGRALRALAQVARAIVALPTLTDILPTRAAPGYWQPRVAAACSPTYRPSWRGPPAGVLLRADA